MVTPYGFHGGQNGVWVGFSRDFICFHLPQISFYHFSTLISFSSASAMVHQAWSSTQPCVKHELRKLALYHWFFFLLLRTNFGEFFSLHLWLSIWGVSVTLRCMAHACRPVSAHGTSDVARSRTAGLWDPPFRWVRIRVGLSVVCGLSPRWGIGRPRPGLIEAHTSRPSAGRHFPR